MKKVVIFYKVLKLREPQICFKNTVNLVTEKSGLIFFFRVKLVECRAKIKQRGKSDDFSCIYVAERTKVAEMPVSISMTLKRDVQTVPSMNIFS